MIDCHLSSSYRTGRWLEKVSLPQKTLNRYSKEDFNQNQNKQINQQTKKTQAQIAYCVKTSILGEEPLQDKNKGINVFD